MSYFEIVETSANGKFRAKITVDEDAQKPDYESEAPILQLEAGGYNGYTIEAFNSQAEPYVDAAERLIWQGVEVFERYLRIFHGTTVFSEYNTNRSREFGYIGFDTAVWRESMGVSPEQLKEENILSEVEAWASGDVWGVSVEKLVSWSTEDEDYDDFDDWEEVPDTAVWGWYGHAWAEQEAKAELARVVAEDAAK
jgi:hypothetical protein